MVLAVLFCIAVWSAGFGTLRALGLSKGPLGFGLAPSVGLAVLAIVSTWAGLPRLPAPVPGALVGAICLVGLAFAASDAATTASAAGGGCVVAFRLWSSGLGRLRNRVAHRVTLRMGRLLVVTWALLCCVLMVSFLSVPATMLSSFSAVDDVAAMAWLSTHTSTSDVVVNDRFADAGLWAPYKAGARILEYRSSNDPSTAAMRDLVLHNIGHLESSPEAMAAACSLRAAYVYYGAETTKWQARTFPSVEDMRASSALQTVFEHGDATLFKVNLNC
jgi:hypothetical protein